MRGHSLNIFMLKVETGATSHNHLEVNALQNAPF